MTDANVVLGRLNPGYFLGGRSALDADEAQRVVSERVADPLGISPTSAALAIVRIADAHMSDLVRRVSIERGFDPRRFLVYAFGGAGPLHAGAYAASLGARGALVPAFASEFSAFGIAGSDLLAVAEISQPARSPLDVDRLETLFKDLEELAAEELRSNGVDDDSMRFRRYVRLRYGGQVHELRTPVPPLNGSDAPLIDEFERLYEAKFGRGAAYKQAGVQAMTYIVHGYGTLFHPVLAKRQGSGSAAAVPTAERLVVFESEGEVPTAVYRSADLSVGATLSGPAIVEAPTTTILVHPGQGATVDAYGNLVLSFH